MLTFNTLLQEEGIDPAGVKLVRHQDTRGAGRRAPYELWRAQDGSFELYQRIQRLPVFSKVQRIASFVATPLNETVFVGLYRVDGVGTTPKGMRDPSTGASAGKKLLYKLTAETKLSAYQGRLIIDWGDGYRAWHQRAARQKKPVVELRRKLVEERFPGFLDFSTPLSKLPAVPVSWRNALASVGGVYLLSCPKTGKQYVGQAKGGDGLWGRWEAYVASGHGGNRRMKELPISDYQVTVLEIAPLSADADAINGMEERWKKKLQSRKFGLNGN